MKKFLCFLSVLVLTVMVSIFSVACGDKYKNMYLEVQYLECTYTDEGMIYGEWKTVDTNPNSENYGLSFVLKDIYKLDSSDYYSLKMRVLVKGTKKKVEKIYVSCPEGELDKWSVTSGEEFTIRFSDTQSPYLFVSPCVKAETASRDFPIVLYSELDSIEANQNYYPAVAKGSTVELGTELELNALADLIVYHGKDGIDTNQEGVTYSIEGVEHVDGVYTYKDPSNANACLVLDTRNNVNRVWVDAGFNQKTVTLKATSVYKDYIQREDKSGLECDVHLMIVDNIALESVNVNYSWQFDATDDNKNHSNELKEITLYSDSTDYNQTNLVLSGTFTDASNFNFVPSTEHEVAYMVNIFVFDADTGKYEDIAKYNNYYRGIQITELESQAKFKKYNIELYEYSGLTENLVKFVIGFDNLKFTGKDYNLQSSVLEYNLKVVRDDLPKAISINGKTYSNTNSFSDVLFSTYQKGEGFDLSINAVRNLEKKTEIKLKFTTDISSTTKDDDGDGYGDDYNKIEVYDFNDRILSSNILTELSNNIYVKFEEKSENNYPSKVYVQFEVLSSPLNFEGQAVTDKTYIKVNLTLVVSGNLTGVTSTNGYGVSNNLFDATNDKLIEANKRYATKINLESDGGLSVAPEKVIISSEKNQILVSADGLTWKNNVKCSDLIDGLLYIKAETGVEDKLQVVAENGTVVPSTTIKFVETTGINNPTLSFDGSHVYSAKEVSDYYDGSKGYYLIMQYGNNADFKFEYGANKTAGIYSTQAKNLTGYEVSQMGKTISRYAVDSAKPKNFTNGYSFNLSATTADFTTVVKVEVKYYFGSGDAIEKRSEIVYLEVAVYVPVTDLTFEVKQDTIYYVNELITDNASTEIKVVPNASASKNIYFSDDELNSKINDGLYNNTGYIYSIFINKDTIDGLVEQGKVPGYNALDLTNSNYTLTLTKNVLAQNETSKDIKINFVVSTFNLGNNEFKYKKTKTVGITITKHVVAEDISIRGTYNNNMYLSLMSEKDKTATFTAKVTNDDATYSKLEYELYEFDELNPDNHYIGDRVFSNEKLKVDINNSTNLVTLTAGGVEGGVFVLRIIAPDSYDDAKASYGLCKYVTINISDGSRNAPYYLRTPDDVKKIKDAPNKHYVLASNINLSTLTEPLAYDFSGSLNGVIHIYDTENKTSVYSQYKFTDIKIDDGFIDSKTDDGAVHYGLFSKVSGTIENLVLDRVKFSLDLADGASNSSANVGALTAVNNGTIVNCSVTMLESSINISANDSNFGKYNIGALIGKNNGTVNYYNQNTSENKKYATTIQSAYYYDQLKVEVASLGAETEINVGGLIGANNNENVATINTSDAALIEANYFNFENKLFKEYLTAYVNVWLNINSSIAYGRYTANLGGIVGKNNGKTSQVCVAGEVKGSGRSIAIGGIVGKNANLLQDSANYTTNVSGLAFKGQTEIQDQFVGGAVGRLDGTINNTNVVFVDLRNMGFDSNLAASINGVCRVGGLVGYMNSGNITSGNVQSFFTTPIIVGNFKGNTYTTSSKLIGGLVGDVDAGTVSTSFVKADIKATDASNVYTLAESGVENSYYIGKVELNGANNETIALNATTDNPLIINSSSNVYSLVNGYNYTNDDLLTYVYGILYYNDGTAGYYYFDNNGDGCWIDGTGVFDDNVIDEAEKISAPNLNLTSSPWSNNADYTKYNCDLPVLEYNDSVTMITLPEELDADVSEDEFKDTDTVANVYQNENGIYISNGEHNSAIVFLSDKTYNLVSNKNTSGLIDKTISPPVIASGQYYVKIIAGSDNCVLVGNTIRFTKVGRIELEFVSLFNSEAKDTVVIYVENPIDGFEIVTGGKTITQLSTQTNVNKLLEFKPLYNGQKSKFNTDNLFFVFDLENSSYIETSSLGYVVGSGYSFESLQLQIKNIDTQNENTTLQANLYLNLANYVFEYNEDETVKSTFKDIFGETTVLVEGKELAINVYQSASSLLIDTADQIIETFNGASMEFDIYSAFIEVDKDNTVVEFIDPNSNYLYTNSNFETFSILIENDNANEWLTKYKLKNLWELFDYYCTYSANDENTGYHFVFSIELKEEYKAISRNEVFTFNISALTNFSANDTTTITYLPQNIKTLRIENYKSGVATLLGDNVTVEYTSNETQSSIIVPGKNGLIKLYVEPEYSNVDVVEITAETIYVSGVPYNVTFQQMLYDQNSGHYISYPGYTTENATLRLQKNTYIDGNGEKKYTGVIYVRTILEKIIGANETFTITANAYTYLRDEYGNYDTANPIIDSTKTKTTTKLLLTEYNPGVELSVTNLETAEKYVYDEAGNIVKDDLGNDKKETVYLIEKNSNNAVINAVIHGYHIDQQPTINITWLDGSADGIYDQVNFSLGSARMQTDGAYVLPIYLKTINLNAGFKFSMSLTLISEGATNQSKVEVLTFYPVDYIPTGVYLKDSGNDFATISVNSSMYFDFIWKSVSQELNSNSINAEWFNKDLEFSANRLDFISIPSYTSSGQLYYEPLQLGEFGTYSIAADNNAKKYTVTALGEGELNLCFRLGYSYEFDETVKKFNIKFYTEREGVGEHQIRYNFTLRFNITTTEETPDAIYTAEQFRAKMTQGGNYILMDNITLTNWAPMDATFASLDGNGKIISIKNFEVATGGEINAGLFSTVSQDTILKNIIVNIGEYEGNNGNNTVMLADENNAGAATNFGFVAGVNNGIIYNSEVISATNVEKNITVETSSEYSYIGLLVGKNQGIITNSRVGTPYYEEIEVNVDGTIKSSAHHPTKKFTITADGIVGGFVATNGGTISSSYFNNADIINTNVVGNDSVNMTAGFVASNSGNIYGSYAKGIGITSENIRGDQTGVSNIGAGSSAGFVFDNSGLIENSYSNLLVQSSSFASAGFVYNNTGTIKQSYSASEVYSGSEGLAVQLPFVGVDIENNLLSNGKLENCYYLQLEDDKFDSNYKTTADMDLPYGLNEVNFAMSENLINFAFVDGNYSQSIQGVWTYYATLDSKDENTYALGRTSLPELTSANLISRSIRYIVEVENEEGEIEHQLRYASGYALGTSQNPYIIRDYNEYNKVFNYNSEDTAYNIFTGNVRLINDINFTLTNGDSATISTTLGYTLGDKNKNTLTVIDGNGMTISGVDTKNNESQEQTSLGLFNEITYSIVKNLNIEFIAMEYTSSRATYSGGLAGRISDSFVIGVDLIGNNTTISAYNFAGGLAGMITGKSGIYNVSSNLNVKVGKEGLFNYLQYISRDKFNTVYLSLGYHFSAASLSAKYDEYLAQLSYAGGLAGVIDIDTDGNYSSSINLNKVVIGDANSVNVVADVAGFVAGHLGRGVYANRLTAVITNNSFVEGAYISGGLVAEHYGKIRYSQVTYADSADYDKAFADYVLSDTVESLDNSAYKYGTLNFVRSDTDVADYKNVAGGFVGVNYGGYVDNSYTKANVSANANYIGGFIGVNYNGTLNSVYAQNYLDISNFKFADGLRTESIGGLIAYNSNTSVADSFAKVYKLNNYDKNDGLKIDTAVATIFFDKDDFITYYENRVDNPSIEVKFDYLIAESSNNISSARGVIQSDYVYYLKYAKSDTDLTYVYFNDYYETKVKNSANVDIWKKLITRSANQSMSNYDVTSTAENIRNLYDLTYDKQEEVFTKLFLSFDMTTWEKDNKKYFPTLKENPTLNLYEINDESDLLLIVLYPKASFVLTGDITLSKERVNYVLDVEFEGILMGRSNADGNPPSIKGIKLYTDNSTSSAGFFSKTKGATIYNINFEYEHFVICNNNGKEFVGLLSAEDEGSEVSGVSIVTKTTIDSFNYAGSNTLDPSEYNDCAILTKDSAVNNFGGLYGTASNSKIINADVKLNADIDGGADTSNVGGLAGLSQGTAGDEKVVVLNSIVSTKLYLDEFDNIGGLIGNASNTSINGGSATIGTKISGHSTYYLGGVMGTQKESYVKDARSTLIVDNEDASIDQATHSIGGVSGLIDNTNKIEAGVVGGLATVNIKRTVSVGQLRVGGIYGTANSVARLENSIAWIYGSTGNTNTILGGLVAYAKGNLIYINNSFAYIENDNLDEGAKGISLGANDTYMKAGGFIGQIENAETVVSIQNSSASGAVWPEGTAESISLGGMIGEWTGSKTIDLSKSVEINGEDVGTNITNSYTTVMLDTSAVKVSSNSSDYNVNAIVGKIGTTVEKIATSQVYFSSDFNLCLEERTIFSNEPIDLLAQALLAAEQKPHFFTNGWETFGTGLPYRTSLSTKLEQIGILQRYNNSNFGTSLNPSYETNLDNVGTGNSPYKYYFITEMKSFSKSGTLNGAILGGGNEVTYTKNNNNALNLNPHSVLSNLKITINSETAKNMVSNKSFGLIGTNKGTIFNVSLDYYFKPADINLSTVTSGGGIVETNSGTMLYCFNTGYLEEVVAGNFGGIATNNSGYIAHSGFVGTITGTSTSVGGLCYKNSGTIYNSYSAGVVTGGGKTFVHTNTGRMENCVYDNLANMEFRAYNSNSGVSEVDTETLQTEGQVSQFGGLKGNWVINPMTHDGKMSYNFGYPIYLLDQKYYDGNAGGEVKYEYFGRSTGNGSVNNPYLITHLGMAELINKLIDTEILISKIEHNFKLINDIDQNKNKLKDEFTWKGIGAESIKFTGTFVGGDREASSSTKTVTVRKIDNLTGSSGLFANLANGAEVGCLAFGNAYLSGTNIGALVNEVVGKSTIYNATDVSIYNVVFGVNDKTTTTSNMMELSGDNVGGLIGRVVDHVNVNLNNINYYSWKDTGGNTINLDIYGVGLVNKEAEYNLYSASAIENLGGFVGEICDHSSVTVQGVKFSLNSNIGDDGTKNKINSTTTGGIVGVVSAGGKLNIKQLDTIAGNGAIVSKENAGGIAGVVNSGYINFETTSDLDLKLALGNESVINAGGIVGVMNGGEIINTTQLDESTAKTVKINLSRLQAKTNAGGLVGSMKNFVAEDGITTKVATIAGFEVSYSGNDKNYYAGRFGGVVGLMNSGNIGQFAKKITATGTEYKELTIKVSGDISVYNASQVGSIVGGICASRNVVLNSVTSELSVKVLEDTKNVLGISSLDKGMGGIAGCLINENTNDPTLPTPEIYLGNITLANNELEAGVNLKNIGGLFGQLKMSALHTNIYNAEGKKLETSIDISGIIVRGVNNVGGFAGNAELASKLVVEEALKNYLDMTELSSPYAKVCLPESTGDVPTIETNASNFGGIFGVYTCCIDEGEGKYSDIDLSFDLVVGDTPATGTSYVNKNNVLYYAPDENFREEFSLSGKREITNVGGVAGTIITYGNVILNASNMAQYVGSGYENGNNKQYSTLTDKGYLSKNTQDAIMRINCVGGIVGNVSIAENVDANNVKVVIDQAKNSFDSTINGFENVGGVTGALSLNVEVMSAEIAGKVYGRKYLGGIAGSISGTITWNPKFESAGEWTSKSKVNIKNELSGHSYIGGVVGNLTGVNSKIGALNKSGKINGLVNIGGIIGYVNAQGSFEAFTQNNTTDGEGNVVWGVYVEGSYDIQIQGNSNVGGIVGYVDIPTNSEEQQEFTIQGYNEYTNGNRPPIKVLIELFEYNFGTDKETKQDIFYMPASVGGLVGVANHLNIVSTKIEGNITKLNTEGTKYKVSSVSTLNNYVLDANEKEYLSGKYTDNSDESTYDCKAIDAQAKSYENTESGIGGLIGSSLSLKTMSAVGSYMNICVPTGMNVGGIIGYYNYVLQKDAEGNVVPLDLSEYSAMTSGKDIYIAGGLGVGAVFGSLECTETITFSNNTYQRSNNTYLQKKLVKDENGSIDIDGTKYSSHSVFGTYVGGLIGKSTSIQNLRLTADANITIDNSEGSAYGGLVGWLKDGMVGAENKVSNLFVSSNTFNYGGLVGLVKVNNGSDLEVKGTHLYDFTVCTVQLNDLKMDSASVDIYGYKNDLMMVGMLLNNSTVTISSAKVVKTYNPILGEDNSSGWDKEYSMFKEIQLAYDEGETTAIVPAYDAINVLAVKHEGGKIWYTVYDNGGQKLLYHRDGIATYFYDEEPTELEEKEVNGENVQALKPTSNKKDFLQSLKAKLEIYDLYKKDNNVYALANNQERVDNLEYIIQVKFKYNKVESPGDYTPSKSAYVIKNLYERYLDGGKGEDKEEDCNNIIAALNHENTYIPVDCFVVEQGKAAGVYKCDTFYADYDSNEYVFKYTDRGLEFGKLKGEDLQPINESSAFKYYQIEPSLRTWSLFDILGNMENRRVTIGENTADGWAIFWSFLIGALVVIGGIVLGFFTAGTAWAFWAYALVIAGAIGGIFSGVFAIISYNVGQIGQINANKVAMSEYLTEYYEGQYGYISSIYSRPWEFDDYKLLNVSDDVVLASVNVTKSDGRSSKELVYYLYYSTTQPAFDINNPDKPSYHDQYGNRRMYEIEETIPSAGVDTTFYLGEAGDKVPMFYFYNGAYYLNMFVGGKVDYKTVQNISSSTKWDPLIYTNKDNGIYLRKDVEYDKFGGGDIDSGKISDNISTEKTISYSFVGFSYDEGKQESVDYITIDCLSDKNEFYWKVVDPCSSSDHQACIKLYAEVFGSEINDGWVLGRDHVACLVPYAEKLEGSETAKNDIGEGKWGTDIKVGDIVGSKALYDYNENSGGKLSDIAKKSLYFKHGTSSDDMIVQRTYEYYLYLDAGADYVVYGEETEVDLDNDNNKDEIIKPVYVKSYVSGLKNVTVYDSEGSAVSLSEIIDFSKDKKYGYDSNNENGLHADLKDYYIVDISEYKSLTTEQKSNMSVYNNYYYKDGAFYLRDAMYFAEKDGSNWIVKEIVVSEVEGANYTEGKNLLELTVTKDFVDSKYYIFTRFRFNEAKWNKGTGSLSDLTDYLNDQQMFEITYGKGKSNAMVDVDGNKELKYYNSYLIETAMIQFSSYENGERASGFICVDPS